MVVHRMTQYATRKVRYRPLDLGQSCVPEELLKRESLMVYKNALTMLDSYYFDDDDDDDDSGGGGGGGGVDDDDGGDDYDHHHRRRRRRYRHHHYHHQYIHGCC